MGTAGGYRGASFEPDSYLTAVQVNTRTKRLLFDLHTKTGVAQKPPSGTLIGDSGQRQKQNAKATQAGRSPTMAANSAQKRAVPSVGTCENYWSWTQTKIMSHCGSVISKHFLKLNWNLILRR